MELATYEFRVICRWADDCIEGFDISNTPLRAYFLRTGMTFSSFNKEGVIAFVFPSSTSIRETRRVMTDEFATNSGFAESVLPPKIEFTDGMKDNWAPIEQLVMLPYIDAMTGL